MAMILTLDSAIAEQDKNIETAENNRSTTEVPVPETTISKQTSKDEEISVMDLPVNFSTPEDIEKSFQIIGELAGEAGLAKLKSALQYLLFYDVSVGHNEEKMYKKLNGRTPNQIISKMNR
jgi:hypothetical protein